METTRFGLSIRALRRRRGWRQQDLADRASVSRAVIWRAERGRADRMTVHALERIVDVLGARLEWRILWGGERLDRLLDADHAALVEHVVRELTFFGWEVATEVSFSIWGDRGSVDVLGHHLATGTILVVEVKSAIPDLQVTLATLDRKTRLAPEIARSRGWTARRIGRLLVAPDDRTARRRVAQHASTFQAAFPVRGRAVHRWLRHPAGDPVSGTSPSSSSTPSRQAAAFSGLIFLADAPQGSARHRVSGPRRTSAAASRTTVAASRTTVAASRTTVAASRTTVAASHTTVAASHTHRPPEPGQERQSGPGRAHRTTGA